MIYSIQAIQEKLSIAPNEMTQLLQIHNVRVKKKGLLSKKEYDTLLIYFSKGLANNNLKPSHTSSDNNVQIRTSPIYKSSNGRVSIYQEDAISFLQNLPANSVDLIVTDPAYSGMNQMLKLGSGKIIGNYSDAGNESAKWFKEFHDSEENYKVFLEACFKVLKNDRHIYLMFDSFSLLSLASLVREIFEVKNIICWDKANIGLGHYFRRRHEFILFASKGKRSLNCRNIPDVWKIKRVTSSVYPTQKPVEVFELMLKGSADKDFVICDPFLGSGSAAIASIKYNCKFLGCDISGKSISIAKHRISQFLESHVDPYQKSSLLADDEAIIKLLLQM